MEELTVLSLGRQRFYEEGETMGSVKSLSGLFLVVMLVVGATTAPTRAQDGQTDDPAATMATVVELVQNVLDNLVEVDARLSMLEARLSALEEIEAEQAIQTGSVGLPYDADGIRAMLRLGNREVQGVVGGRVQFPKAFSSVPRVQLSLRELDIGNTTSTRLRLEVTSVDREGFNYNMYSWAGTRVYSVTASWIAVTE